jgi:hypothetical protein
MSVGDEKTFILDKSSLHRIGFIAAKTGNNRYPENQRGKGYGVRLRQNKQDNNPEHVYYDRQNSKKTTPPSHKRTGGCIEA